MRKHPFILATVCMFAFLLHGCLFISPIEEAPEPEDMLPFINALSGVSPSMGLVTVDLSSGGNQEFIISDYGDRSSKQTLYHRIVIDYRSAGVTANPIYALSPQQILPKNRDRISYSFRACSAALSYPNTIVDGSTLNLYVVLADEPFMHQNQLFSASNFSQPFETLTQRGSVWVQWTLQFTGKCPGE